MRRWRGGMFVAGLSSAALARIQSADWTAGVYIPAVARRFLPAGLYQFETFQVRHAERLL